MKRQRAVRAQHFSTGLGDGTAKQIRHDDVFPASQRLTPYVRSRRNAHPAIFNKDFSHSGDGIPPPATADGPWKISAMVLLCIMGLLVGLFLHLVTDSAEKHQAFPPVRRVRPQQTKKKKDDYWSDDEDYNDADNEGGHAYYPPYKQQQHRHRGTTSNSGTLHHRYKGPSSSRHAPGKSTSPGPTLRTTRSIDSSSSRRPVLECKPSQEEDVPAQPSPSWMVASTSARPLSPISSFASMDRSHDTSMDTSHVGDEETGTPSRKAIHGTSSFDASARLSVEETPRAGCRMRNNNALNHAHSFPSGQGGISALPPPPIMPSTDRTKLPYIPDLTLEHSLTEPPAEHFRANDRLVESEHPYPGHAIQVEEEEDDNDPRKNIVHKRNDITHCTDAESSLMSSVDFSEIKLDSVIGGGGFGQVWKATWRSTPVAVKILTGSAQREIVSRAILEEFAAEINMLKGMRHPNICLYMGACFEPPNRCIITELAANGSLWDALRLPLTALYTVADGVSRDAWPSSLYGDHDSSFAMSPPPVAPKGTWPWILVKRVACGAARGMTYLHSGDPPVLHRDLKSANLLLDESYTAKVCDFGLSRLKAQERSMTGNCGTVQWMAPEVLANQRYAEPADVYSFAIILWEMLTGECPYEGQSAIQCALAVLNQNHRPEIPPYCPASLAALIRACWQKDPSKRPTFAQILMALDAMP